MSEKDKNNKIISRKKYVDMCRSLISVIFISIIIIIVLPIILSDIIYLVSNSLHIIPNLENIPMGILTVDEDEYITARSIITYRGHLFPEFKNNNSLVQSLMEKSFLDIGSGANHIYKDSLLYKLIHKNAKWSKGIDICCSKLEKNAKSTSLDKI